MGAQGLPAESGRVLMVRRMQVDDEKLEVQLGLVDRAPDKCDQIHRRRQTDRESETDERAGGRADRENRGRNREIECTIE